MAISLETALALPVTPIRLRPAALAFVRAAEAAGVEVVVISSLASVSRDPAVGEAEDFFRGGRVPPDVEMAWQAREDARAALRDAGVAARLWEVPGRPDADMVVDSAAAPVPLDWGVIAAELGIPFANGREGPEKVGGSPPVSPAPGGAAG